MGEGKTVQSKWRHLSSKLIILIETRMWLHYLFHSETIFKNIFDQ